jgi:hypothetical protein
LDVTNGSVINVEEQAVVSKRSAVPPGFGDDKGHQFSSPFWRRFQALLVALVVCRGLMILCVLPLFEGWDKYQHIAYVQHLRKTGLPPRMGFRQSPGNCLTRW